MERRIRFVEYKGKQILLEDLSGIQTDDELINLIKQAQQVVKSQPPKSVLVVVDLSKSRLSPKVYQFSKAATDENSPYVKASTIVGISSITEWLAKAVSTFAGRELASFGTREDAMEWLIKQ